MKTEKNTLHTLAVYSDCGQHRYLLKKIFSAEGSEVKKAAVIMLHPCARDINEMDTTSMLVTNNLLKLGFTEIHMLNVFSKLNANLAHDTDMNNTPDNDKTISVTEKNHGFAVIVAENKDEAAELALEVYNEGNFNWTTSSLSEFEVKEGAGCNCEGSDCH